MPTPLEMAQSFTESMLKTAESVVVHHVAFVTPEEKERRLAICKTCEELEPAMFRCRKCGCFMNFKAALVVAHCPLRKWYAEPITSVLSITAKNT